MKLASSSICPSSSLNYDTISSEEGRYLGKTNTYIYNAEVGPISGSLYYMYYTYSPVHVVIRKNTLTGIFQWMAAIVETPNPRSLAIDSQEQHVYFATHKNPLSVCRLSTGNGGIVDVQSIPLDGESYDVKVHVISDDSGYFIIGEYNSYVVSICKYLFSSPITCQCQQIPNFTSYAYGQLLLSDTTLFMLGSDPSDYALHLYRITFTNTSPDWSSKMMCSSSSCSVVYASSFLSSSKIYSLFSYGQSPKYLYFVTLSLNDGNVLSSRYKSSISCTYGSPGLTTTGDYVIASVCTQYLLVYNTILSTFLIKTYGGNVLNGMSLESTTGRLLVWGTKNPNGFITKFPLGSLVAHPDFQITATWTMNILPPGTEDITLNSGEIIGAVAPLTVTPQTFTNVTLTYDQVSSSTTDVNYITNDQSYSILEENNAQFTPGLPCSITGLTSIAFSIGNCIAPPSWVLVNPSTGVLAVNAPQVASDTEFDFCINSSIAGVTAPVQNLIKLTVLNCISSNCKKCISTSSSICEICLSGYDLSSRSCVSLLHDSTPNSTNFDLETAKTLKISAISIVGITNCIIIVASAMNATSFASLWMTINQLQLFFLLLLTRAYIPSYVQVIIKGCDFASNIYEYIPLKRFGIYPSFMSNFEFNLSNSILESVEIKYDSSIANTYSFFVSICLVIIFTLLICFLRCLFSNYCQNNNCKCFINIVNWIFKIMIFSYFIRNALEISQYILISSIHEINHHNTENSDRSISFVFAILMLSLFLFVFGLILFLIFSSYKIEENRHNKLEEFFRGIKSNKRSRLYTSMQLFRRVLFITMLITLVTISSKLLIGILSFLQFIYVGLLVFIRPYKEIKENAIEIINEVYFTLLLFALIFFNKENEWNSAKTNAYMWFLVSNTIVVFIIVVAFVTKDCILCIKRKLKKNINNIENTSQITPKLTTENNHPSNLNQKTNEETLTPSQSILSSNQLYEENRYYLPRYQPEDRNIKARQLYLRTP